MKKKIQHIISVITIITFLFFSFSSREEKNITNNTNSANSDQQNSDQQNSDQQTNDLRNVANELNDIIQQAVDSAVSDRNPHLSALDISNASFKIFDDRIVTLDSTYSYDIIKYLDNYLCIYSKNGLLNLVSHIGSKINLHDFKFEEITGLNGKENILHNDECEFYYTEYRTSVEYDIYKFNQPRSKVIEELSVDGGKYIGRGLIKKTTSRKVWREDLSIEQNIRLYGMNAWVQDEEYKESKSVEKLSGARGWNHGESIYNIE